MSIKRTNTNVLKSDLARYQDWMRANGRRNVERAKQISSQIQLIRAELERRAA